jgi:hypothetical protein
MKVLVSLSKGKKGGGKKKTGRSLMLSTVMPHLSGENGDQLVAAVEKLEGDKVEAIMVRIGKKLREELELKRKK